jgi:hypothetical protein
MNVGGKSEVDMKPVNVLALFEEIVIPSTTGSNITVEEDADFLDQEEEVAPLAVRRVASPTQFPDQSIHVLDEQLLSLKESLARIKFYLGDIDDLLPR